MLCDNLEAISPRGGGRSKSRGIYVYMWLIHFFVQRKLSQHCQTTILQLKKNHLCPDIPYCLRANSLYFCCLSLSLSFFFFRKTLQFHTVLQINKTTHFEYQLREIFPSNSPRHTCVRAHTYILLSVYSL